MGLSVNELTYAGADTFDLNFALGYISAEDVTAYTYDAVNDPDAENPVDLTFDFNTETQVTLTAGHGLTIGDPVVFRRTVSKLTLPVDVTVEGDATRENLQKLFLYTVMALHEVLDGRTADPGAFETVDTDGLQIIFDYDYLDAYTTARDS